MKSVRSSLIDGSLAETRKSNNINVEDHFDIFAVTRKGHRITRVIRRSLQNTVQTELGKESKKNGRVT